MSGNKTVERPEGLKQGRPAPEMQGLNAMKNFGSATKAVLSASNRIMGGQRDTVVRRADNDAHQTARPDNPEAIKLPLGYSTGDFKTSQIPNTGPKFSPDDDNRVRPSTQKIMHRSTMNITHGKLANQKGI